MIKCLKCKYHQLDGVKHTCPYKKGKIVYGQLQMTIIEHCSLYELSDEKKAQQEYYNTLLALPIDDSGHKIGKKWGTKK